MLVSHHHHHHLTRCRYFGRKEKNNIYPKARIDRGTSSRTVGRLTPANKRFLLSLGLRLKRSVHRRRRRR